ncbi:PEP-CTERM sorting domain-containing protein [Duganella sp. BuS-21]|uniref:PEP-CTERM sorting domain-containing protein n=1 Tax=Duganella sp. BuS-21 TaxID=2943848 RepID=UPI0035A6F3FD
MFAKMSLKLSAFIAAAAFSTLAGAVENGLQGQYTLTSSATQVIGDSNQYVFDYAIKNVSQGYELTQTGLDGFTIYIPNSAEVVSVTAPSPYFGAPGYWSTGASASLDLRGDGSQNMVAPAGYKAYTFWGQYTESVYQIGSTAHFSITLDNVSVGQNTVGISTYFGGYGVPSGQEFAHNEYGNYTTFTTNAVSAITAVPEPETYAMMLAGLGLVGLIARRRRQA